MWRKISRGLMDFYQCPVYAEFQPEKLEDGLKSLGAGNKTH
jgi:hypothetical protein